MIRKEAQIKIKKKIHKFNIHALLKLLKHLGYQEDDILFKSHLNACSPGSLIQDIKFHEHPIKKVIIKVNFGLLAANTPLPSYFFKQIEQDNFNENSFIDFLSFFDHQIIKKYINSIYPEFDTTIYSDFEKTKERYLKILPLNSCNFLHKLFQLIFPEIGILVGKNKHQRTLKTNTFVLGESIIGESSTFGNTSKINVKGYDINLYCEEEFNQLEVQWAEEITKRLYNYIFPILKGRDLHLRIILTIISKKGWVKLQKLSYLGIDKIQGGENKNRVVVIFQGQVPHK